MNKACGLKAHERNFVFQRGHAHSCCRANPESLINFTGLKQLQAHWDIEAQQLAQGVELENCAYCWKLEHQGVASPRQSTELHPESFQIFVDNLCNQMCSYCSPGFSSVWQESIEQHGQFIKISATSKKLLDPDPIAEIDVDHWIGDIKDYLGTVPSNSVIVSLMGGEPLMQIKNIEMLQQFDQTKIKCIQIVTNLNPPSPKFLHRLVELFPPEKLHITISLDATPEYNHVPRAGFVKQRFIDNLEFLQDCNIAFKFVSVISVLSIFDLFNFVNWTQQNHFDVEFNFVNNPDCLHIQTLPEFVRKNILTSSNLPDAVVKMLQHTRPQVDLKLVEQYNYLIQYFRRTGIDPNAVDNSLFVQYWTWLTQYVKENYESSTCK